MRKLSKKILKRFESIKWDAKDFIFYPIDLKFQHSSFIMLEDVIIQDFFISENDKYPFISLFMKTLDNKKSDALIGFGWGKNTIYKKCRNITTDWAIPAPKHIFGDNAFYSKLEWAPVFQLIAE